MRKKADRGGPVLLCCFREPKVKREVHSEAGKKKPAGVPVQRLLVSVQAPPGIELCI